MSLNAMSIQPSFNPILKTRLKWLMVFRVILVIIFYSTSIYFQFKQTASFQPTLYPIYAIIIIIFLLTILYAIVFRWVGKARPFAYVQIFGDILLITATVYATGGIESLLSFLYFLSIISASMLLNRRGGFYAASASSIAYGILVNLDFYRVLPSAYKAIGGGGISYERGDILATLFLNIIGFFTVAFLTGYLAERTVKAEKELEEKEIDYKKLEALNKYIVENINSGILTVDGEGRITSFNRAAERITGYNFDFVYRKPIDAIFPDFVKRGDYSTFSHEEDTSYFRIDKLFRRRDGKEIFLGLSVTPMREGGHIVIFQDLTKLKSLEEQLRRIDRLRALGELAAGMAHEVRNPLSSISGSVQVLKDSLLLDGDNRHLMDIVIRETDRLNALITDFLLFAKPATKMKNVDLSGIINSTVDMFKNSPEAKGVEILVGLDDKLVVEGDSRQLKQVFWNLFLNAGHAMPDGGRLKIEARRMRQGTIGHTRGVSHQPDSVEITVSDTGIGISPENIERIFDPFFTTKESGTGLGLALVHRIIENHRGRIEINSKKGEGTSFKITLPTAKQV